MTVQEFWSSTVYEITAIIDSYQEEFEVKYVLPILQNAVIADFFARAAYGMKTEPKMFIPELGRTEPTPSDPVANSMALMANWEAFAKFEESKKRKR
jgi:hypothetical protein